MRDVQKLASLMAKAEGKKSQAKYGDLIEALARLTDIIAADWNAGGKLMEAFDGIINKKVEKLEKAAARANKKKK